jgi:hypothetical protein
MLDSRFWPDAAVAGGWTLYFAATQYVGVLTAPADVQGVAIGTGAILTSIVALPAIPMMMSKKWGVILQLVLQLVFLGISFAMFSRYQYSLQVGQMLSLGVALYCFLRLMGILGPRAQVSTASKSPAD